MSRILLLVGVSVVTVSMSTAGMSTPQPPSRSTVQSVPDQSALQSMGQLGQLGQLGQQVQPQANWGHSSPPPRWGGGR